MARSEQSRIYPTHTSPHPTPRKLLPRSTLIWQVSSSFGTISEYFFLTMRVLHMGLLSSFGMMENLMKQHQRLQEQLQARNACNVYQWRGGVTCGTHALYVRRVSRLAVPSFCHAHRLSPLPM